VGFLARNDRRWVGGVDASSAIGRVGAVGSAWNTVAVIPKISKSVNGALSPPGRADSFYCCHRAGRGVKQAIRPGSRY
jgi:hypothetical protein